MIFVGPNDSTNMVAAIFFALGATCPKARCLDQDFCARLDKKAIVAGSLPVVPHAEGHICADVLLLLSREDPYDLTVGSDHKRGRHLFAAIGQLPCVEGAPIPKPGGFGSCRSKRVVAVHDERARRLRISEYEKRQHKNVGVPEHMPLVGGSAQPAGANGHAIVFRVRRTQTGDKWQSATRAAPQDRPRSEGRMLPIWPARYHGARR